MFSETEKAYLIELIRHYPPLYDIKHEGYKDNNTKKSCWERVAEELQKPVHVCKNEWEKLRASYRRCKREERDGRASSKKKKWHFYDNMQYLDESLGFSSDSSHTSRAANEEAGNHFDEINSYEAILPPDVMEAQVAEGIDVSASLVDCYRPQSVDGSFSTAEESNESLSYSTPTGSTCSLSSKRKSLHLAKNGKKKKNDVPVLSKLSRLNAKALLSLQNVKLVSKEADEEDAFGEYVKHAVRGIRDTRVREDAKLKIMQILCEAKSSQT